MPLPFSSLLRTVEADGHQTSLRILATGVLLLGCWLGWLLFASVPLYVSSGEARLVVAAEAHPVVATTGGRIAAIRMELGQKVEAAQVLLELESDEQRLQLQKSNARLAGLAAQRSALAAQIRAEEEADAYEQEATRLALEEAQVRHEAAVKGVRLAEDEENRTRFLRTKEVVGETEYQRATATTQAQQMTAEALKLLVAREEMDAKARHSARKARLEELRRAQADVAGETAMEEAHRAELEYALERRKVRAPTAGRVGEIAPLRVGAQLQGGERLGSVVPAGELKVVVDFPPAEAIGRIREGQSAQVRLDGFPWTQYGTVQARVRRVASEVRDGRIRVECELRPEPGSSIPFQHGLTGAVEIEVERVSPVVLMLRAAGQRVAAASQEAQAR